MLPYLAQGANSAIEDGVVLGECLKRVSCRYLRSFPNGGD